MSRCLYNSSFEKFINSDENSIFGALCDNYHGDALTTTREAWKAEISVIKGVLSNYADKNGQVIFEYDIPRLGKRIDVVLLLEGIVFCVEFKVGESKILEADVDQVLDYALDLKNFHKFSQDILMIYTLRFLYVLIKQKNSLRLFTHCWLLSLLQQTYIRKLRTSILLYLQGIWKKQKGGCTIKLGERNAQVFL